MGVKVTFLRDTEEGGNGARRGGTPMPAAQPVTLVPKAAIRVEGDQSYAFVVSGGIVDRRAIKTGGADGDRVEVVAGLRAGDRVVVSPPATLAAGAIVTEKQ
jgi:hypothetical protein